MSSDVDRELYSQCRFQGEIGLEGMQPLLVAAGGDGGAAL